MDPAASPPTATPVTASHAVRKSVLEKGERIWRAEPEGLSITLPTPDPAAPFTTSIPWAKIAELRLRFEPGRFATNRCMAQVVTNTGWMAEIDNQHYAGLAEFEDRSASYRAMIELLLLRLRAANPQARLVTGQGTALWLSMGFLLLMLLALFLVVLTIGGPLIALIKLGVLAFFAPTMVRYIRVNRRRVLPIAADPPAGVLPEIA